MGQTSVCGVEGEAGVEEGETAQGVEDEGCGCVEKVLDW